ncbi:MAG: hypothetical protein K2N80_04085 [Lachnospiraceae bacterium]|nr:hypothetical protein [Lachnospiraceae bacterium]
MRYKTKVTVITGGREYQPGKVLPADISADDLLFLKSKGFVEPMDIVTVATEIANEEDDFFGFNESEPDELKSSEEIKKIRSKKELVRYAASIGLNLGDGSDEKSLKELQEEVINFQEEYDQKEE